MSWWFIGLSAAVYIFYLVWKESRPQHHFEKGVVAYQAKDYSKAFRSYHLAATSGHVHAQVELGDMHAEGRGVPQNYVNAHVWFNTAAVTGNSSAINKRMKIEEKMTPSQISTAQKLANRRY